MDQATATSTGIVESSAVSRFELQIQGYARPTGRNLPQDSTDREDAGSVSANLDQHRSNVFSSGLRGIALPNALQPHSRSARARLAPASPGAGRVSNSIEVSQEGRPTWRPLRCRQTALIQFQTAESKGVLR